MSRRFRTCMANGGRESARPSYGRSKLPLILRKKKSPSTVFRKTFWPLKVDPYSKREKKTLGILSKTTLRIFSILVHPLRRQSFAGKLDSTFWNSSKLIIAKSAFFKI